MTVDADGWALQGHQPGCHRRPSGGMWGLCGRPAVLHRYAACSAIASIVSMQVTAQQATAVGIATQEMLTPLLLVLCSCSTPALLNTTELCRCWRAVSCLQSTSGASHLCQLSFHHPPVHDRCAAHNSSDFECDIVEFMHASSCQSQSCSTCNMTCSMVQARTRWPKPGLLRLLLRAVCQLRPARRPHSEATQTAYSALHLRKTAASSAQGPGTQPCACGRMQVSLCEGFSLLG